MSARCNLRASALSLTLLEDCYDSFDVQVGDSSALPQPIKSLTHLEVSYFLTQIIQAWPVAGSELSVPPGGGISSDFSVRGGMKVWHHNADSWRAMARTVQNNSYSLGYGNHISTICGHWNPQV